MLAARHSIPFPPGTYHFRIAASMANGLWSEYTLPADIVVIPAFYQTTWFMVMCAVAVLAALAVGHRLQIQYVTARMRDRRAPQAGDSAVITGWLTNH